MTVGGQLIAALLPGDGSIEAQAGARLLAEFVILTIQSISRRHG